MSWVVQQGDCLEALSRIPDNSVDSIVTDPPYGLSNHSAQDTVECLRAWIAGEAYKPYKRGFMGKSWDAWVPGPEVWRECLRVLKPGGHCLVFAGTRSMDLMCMALRLAGFELRDTIGHLHDSGGSPLLTWTYGSGFPKSMNVSKAIQAQQTRGSCSMSDQRKAAMGEDYTPSDVVGHTANGSERAMNCTRSSPPAISVEMAEDAKQWSGWGTALKPAFEPIIIARKPLIGTVAQNVLEYGTGAMNIDGCRVGTSENLNGGAYAKGGSPRHDGSENWRYKREGGAGEFEQPQGRWPANLVLSYPEDQYELRTDISDEQRAELCAWLAERGEQNADQ